MPLVFSPPPRLTHEPDEFATGSAQEQRPACHSRSPNAPRLPRAAPRIGAAVGAAVLLLSACTAGPEEHTLATPTAATPTDTAEAVPEYTTDLQLSEEEKKAVEASLMALNRYVEISNDVFTSGGVGADQFDDVAKDSRLFAAKNEAESLRSDGVRMTGEFRITKSKAFDVDLDMSDDTAIPFVAIHSCVPGHEFSYSDIETDTQEPSGEKFDTFEFVIAKYDEDWFVSEQYLWDSGCDF